MYPENYYRVQNKDQNIPYTTKNYGKKTKLEFTWTLDSYFGFRLWTQDFRFRTWDFGFRLDEID